MKKMFALTAALYSMLCLAGCLMEDDEDLFPQEALSPEEWVSFTFQSLSGHDDLQITRSSSTSRGSYTLDPASITTFPNNKHRFLAISTYKKDCEFCKEQAPWLDKLAEDFSLQGIDFIIVFVDMFDNSDISEVRWANRLSRVKAYTNATVCNSNACKQIVSPNHMGPTAGSIYFVDKKDLANVEQGPYWYSSDDPEEWYERTRSQLEKYLHAQPVVFEAGVSDWTEKDPSDNDF